ncbi:hypothetical protein F4779DRAFT_618556 [Xylariaceae sp. FL0662B]|nr:hypothetical protein F4779DRAFT_618556 [Xylariaceae sp. FL0662B]
MPPLDTESQFKFLIACIKHSSAGKVDFGEVARECEIVTKGAAAKRYERLMKAHGIAPGSSASVKKESKDTKEPAKSRAPNKKRKLAAVDEDAGDIDEPVKSEVKGEVKNEDAITVKAELENSGVAPAPGTTPANAPTPQPGTATPSSSAQNDDDDEIFLICATEKRDDGHVPVYGGGHHYSHSHSPTPAIPGIHSFDYAANMGFPQQMTPATRMAPSHNSLPYGFPAGNWMYPHDAHGYL